MSAIPRDRCPVEATYESDGSGRTRLIRALIDRQPGTESIYCFVPPMHELDDAGLQQLKAQVISCNTCVRGANCPLGELIMSAQLDTGQAEGRM